MAVILASEIVIGDTVNDYFTAGTVIDIEHINWTAVPEVRIMYSNGNVEYITADLSIRIEERETKLTKLMNEKTRITVTYLDITYEGVIIAVGMFDRDALLKTEQGGFTIWIPAKYF